MRTLTRGLLAGAAGTAVLDALTYADMALRGRAPSSTPEDSVDRLLDALGVGLPGDRAERRHRRTALGALLGTASGLAAGVAASAARRAGFRLRRPAGVLVVAAATMTATNAPMVVLGVSDPRTWTAGEWAADVVPHLGFALAADAVLRLDPRPEAQLPLRRPPLALVLRAAALGLAAGARSSLGIAAPIGLGTGTPAATGPIATTASAAGVAGELVADKLPQAPDRTGVPGLPARFASSAVGAMMLARRDGARPTVPVLAAAAGTTAGAFGGQAWRRWAAQRVPDWPAALVEDAVALALAFAAARPGRRAASS